VKEVSLSPRVRAVAAAGVEEAAACTGRKEPSEGVRSGSKVSRFGPEVRDGSTGRGTVLGPSKDTPDDVSCREEKSS
jgi:hypothetical protein